MLVERKPKCSDSQKMKQGVGAAKHQLALLMAYIALTFWGSPVFCFILGEATVGW